MSRFLRAVLATAVASVSVTTSVFGAYSARDLGAFANDFENSLASDVNGVGQVVGGSRAVSANRAILWPAGTSTLVDLSNLPNLSSASAAAINGVGQIVGSSSQGDKIRPFLWTPSQPNGSAGNMVEVTGLPGEKNHGLAFDINSVGEIVGESGSTAFLWTPSAPNGASGSAVSLGDLPEGGAASYATAVNAAGRVVGVGSAAVGERAFLWTPTGPNGSEGSMIDLGALAEGTTSQATDLNDAGQVVGNSRIDGDSEHAFLWTANAGGGGGTMRDLGALPGGNDLSFARGVNSSGQVVGYSNSADSDHAFLWTDAAGMIDLNTLLDAASGASWTLRYAEAINDSGQIAGWGIFDPDGAAGDAAPVNHAFLLTPGAFAAGDFDENGSVNGDDLTRWRSGFGGTGLAQSQGDADADGDADGADLLVWQRQLVAGGGAAAIPEPGTGLLALGLFAGWIVGGSALRGRRDAEPSAVMLTAGKSAAIGSARRE